jgi:hypothetical protein
MHPYRAAWQTRDVYTWGQELAPDVVLYSPILTTPFRGREAAIELFGVLFEKLGALEITDELVDGDTHAFFWHVQVGSLSGPDTRGAAVDVACDELGERKRRGQIRNL